MTTNCVIEGCKKPIRARGWCVTHYWRWSKHGDPQKLGPRRRETEVCDAPKCERPTPRTKYCDLHRGRLSRHGVLELPPAPTERVHTQGYRVIKNPAHPLARWKPSSGRRRPASCASAAEAGTSWA